MRTPKPTEKPRRKARSKGSYSITLTPANVEAAQERASNFSKLLERLLVAWLVKRRREHSKRRDVSTEGEIRYEFTKFSFERGAPKDA